MKFTLSWLKQFLETDATLEKIAHTLTMIGLEVENIEDKAKNLSCFEVAKIIDTKPHPEADKLQICKVQTKDDLLQIVCGAKNARTGLNVVLAKIGCVIPNGNFKIKATKIRGIESFGMMCSYDEIGIDNRDTDGIIELPENAVIGDRIAQYLGIDDVIIHINITPNRADALGVYGIARDLSAAGIGRLKKLTTPQINAKFDSSYTIDVCHEEISSLFSVREIKNLNNTSSPEWLQNLLRNIGIEPVSAVVDVTNYISYSFGQPMHAYDAEKIDSGLKIDIVSTKTPNELKALNEQVYKIPEDSIVISDKTGIQCLAGIIGASSSACSAATNNILLESAIFNSQKIAKTGRFLNINTDSRYRFERHVDREFTLQALDIATSMILDVCGGEASNAIIYETTKPPITKINFSPALLLSKAGIKLATQEIISILSKLGFVCNNSGNAIEISVPSWRYDVRRAEDIVEEVVRIYGYDNIPLEPLPLINRANTIPISYKRPAEIKRLLASLGYVEAITWSFMDSNKALYFSDLKKDLELQNPISADLNYMRPSILPNLLRISANNLKRSLNDFSLFELGPVFHDNNEIVKTNACGIRIGNVFETNPHENREYDVFDVKSDLELLLDFYGLDIEKCQIKNTAPSYYHPTRSASISLGKNILGYWGQVHPSILKIFDIKTNVIAFELDVNKLPVARSKFGRRSEFRASPYQAIIRDYAFIVNQDLKAIELIRCIKNVDKKLIKDVGIFDIYNGKNIEDGKKSIALSVTIQDDNKTLDTMSVENIHNRIISAVKTNFDAILRMV